MVDRGNTQLIWRPPPSTPDQRAPPLPGRPRCGCAATVEPDSQALSAS